MRREALPGLSVGSQWVIPIRETIAAWELGFVIEAPPKVIQTVFGLAEPEETTDVYKANEILAQMAEAGFTDWRESSFYGRLIAGTVDLFPDGAVWLACEGSALGRRSLEVRTVNPPRAVPFDAALWSGFAEPRR